MKEEKRARLTEIIFHNEENFYTIGVFESGSEQFCATGTIGFPGVGKEYTLTGEWTVHPKYGEQFAFTDCEENEPATEEGIKAFLSSGAIKGIGPATAALIVARFGTDALRIIQEEPGRLTQISGIGPVKASAIHEGYMEQRGYANAVLALSAFGISPATALKLYRTYGSEAADIVKEDPYKLVGDVWGIGFRKADAIAARIGIGHDSPRRIACGISFMLEQSAQNGNTYEEKTALVEGTAQFLDVTRQQVQDSLFELIMDAQVYTENIDGVEAVMLYRYYRAERRVASRLFSLCTAPLAAVAADYGTLIRASEKEHGIELSDQQKLAVISSMKNGVSIITGGPGTGKTTIIRTILSILEASGVETALAAPTGRAAKRMEEATGRPASTIHRLLEYYYSETAGEMRFARTEEDPLDFGCVIIDEMSMVDVLLMDGLLCAVKPGTRLILVGDADQLPPVGAGSVLKDMLKSERISCVRLTDIFRQAAESMIVVNAHLINKGEYPSWNDKNTDFFMLERPSDRSISETLQDLCARRLPAFIGAQGSEAAAAIQVLTPTRKGLLGSVELNRALQAVLNPPDEDKPERIAGGRIYRAGDKVMQNKNDYELEWRSVKDFSTGRGVFNGDIGVIQSVDTDKGLVNVLYDGERLVSYDPSILEEIETAFAMTVHKSQGSEFPVVVMPMTRFPAMLASRNLLYTAVTRAKRAVVLVGDPRVCRAMVDNHSVQNRNSGLAFRIAGIWDFNDQG